MPYFLYILRNSTGKLYIGQTNNISNRTKQHLTKDWKSAKFTKDYEGFEPVYREEFSTRIEAMKREAQIKKWSRVKKEALIAGNIDGLKSLSKRKIKS